MKASGRGFRDSMKGLEATTKSKKYRVLPAQTQLQINWTICAKTLTLIGDGRNILSWITSHPVDQRCDEG
jgi:hypothetical protein